MRWLARLMSSFLAFWRAFNDEAVLAMETAANPDDPEQDMPMWW